MSRVKEKPVEVKVGACWWCKRQDVRVGRGWDRLFKCVDRVECENTRVREHTVNFRRPRSFYELLADGNYPARRDARKTGLKDAQLQELVESLGLTWRVKDRVPKEAAVPDA